jgi:acyl-coenzyme A synthetase/AMP-(fatty) acid ligase
METGGMKGQRKEIIRKELHEILQNAFNVSHIHSEYGMTELLSQAYAQKEGRFKTPPWMQVQIRDIYDPFEHVSPGQTGGMNIIDLGNVHSCAFIATDDIGCQYNDGTFEVLGRLADSDTRGCNLMIR